MIRWTVMSPTRNVLLIGSFPWMLRPDDVS